MLCRHTTTREMILGRHTTIRSVIRQGFRRKRGRLFKGLERFEEVEKRAKVFRFGFAPGNLYTLNPKPKACTLNPKTLHPNP